TLLERTQELDRAREAIEQLPPPRGGCDWPRALQAAWKILAAGGRPRREVFLLTDGQRFGWADDTTLFRWELLGQQLRNRSEPGPRVWVVNLDPNRPANPPNWALAPLHSSRGIASVGQQI